LLSGRTPIAQAPSGEWWPYRNQLLVTLAAAWALPRGFEAVVVGSVRSDGFHVDGTADFYDVADRLLSMQEGGIRVLAPAITMTSAELVQASAVPDDILVWTISCHRGPLSCGDCPGCDKHETLLRQLGRLQ